ncbi:hypothetical protein [Maridesulfovibrio sp. FT414]|uniref:hypothetical protein n=1 Tax=Maridesulfovibrio sp. FT414 TaxID=2979469 RepID=UPI003D805361
MGVADLTLDGSNLILKADSTQKSDPLKQVFPDSYWADRFSRAALKNRYELTAPSLAMDVQSKVRSLSDALGAFRWPSDGFGLSDARLVVNDPELDGKVNSTITPKDDVQRYYRYYSRGFTGEALNSLDAGIYKFDVSLGGTKKNLEVELTSGMDNDAVLEAVRDVVNNSVLPVQARVIRQNVPGANLDDLLGTGSALAFSVNTVYAVTAENRGDDPQDLTAANLLSFSDTSGHLISYLKLYATEKPISPAREARYALSGTVAGSPTQYLSKAFDVNAETTISAGTHSIGYSIGTESGTIDFMVEDGDTWQTVLDRIDNAAGGTSAKVTAKLVDAKLVSPVYTGDGYYLIDGKAVAISAVDPKIGERLVLEPGSGLEALALNVTASPGADSVMVVNGTTETRAPGEFALDRGRVLVNLEENFGDTLPLTVVSAIGEMEKNVGLVTDAYNDLRKTILPSEDLFKEGFADLWRKPVEDRIVDLEWMGLREAEEDNVLWFDSDKFYDALIAEPDKVKEVLEDEEEGLFPSWQDVNDTVVESGVSSYLIQESSLPPLLPEPSPRTELELEVKRELVDTFESTFNFDLDDPAAETGRLFSRKG